MATWLELRCENRGNPSSGLNHRQETRCYSHKNEGPMEMASDTRASVLETLRELEDEARKANWKRTRYGWICPYCAGQPGALEELAASY